MNKKAQGISLNVIIIAAIALLVLVILSVIFMGRMGTFSDKSQDCTSQGGQCFTQSATAVERGNYNVPYTAYKCPDKEGTAQSCYLKV